MKAVAGFVFACVGICLTGLSDDRVLSGYTGFMLGGKNQDHLARQIDLLGSNAFNSIDVKIQESSRFCNPEKHLSVIREHIAHARKVGLDFNIYLYPLPGNGIRHPEWTEHQSTRVPVDALGRPIENAFLLTDPSSWRCFFRHAYNFARLRKELGFRSLRFDIETIGMNLSYDDEAWRSFCSVHSGFDSATPVAERLAVLKSVKGGKITYEEFFDHAVEKAIGAFVRELRAIDPTIELGYMPARTEGLGKCMNPVLATDTLPAWIDGWDMYNGMGYRDSILTRDQAFKAAHPNNRFVPWIRPNLYLPEFVAPAIYHAGARTAGYSIWSLAQLDDQAKRKSVGMRLPGNRTADAYLAAFKAANEALRQDMRDGTLAKPTRIALKRPKPIVANLDWSDVTFPELDPARDGRVSDEALVLREVNTVFLHAKAGEKIGIALKHLAGEKKPIGLQYALVDRKLRVLRNESVTPGQREKFAVIAPETDWYALVVSGGTGGNAWYSVQVEAPLRWLVDARRRAYLFRKQRFAVPGKAVGNASLHMANASEKESFRIRFGNGEWQEIVREGKHDFALPEKEFETIELGSSPAGYGENYFITFPDGKKPFVYPADHGK